MLTKSQLDRYRHLAEEYPSGNIADLINHIDDMVIGCEEILDDLIAVHRSMYILRYSQQIPNEIFKNIVDLKRLLQHEGYEKETGQE